jgi:hypothetical protein
MSPPSDAAITILASRRRHADILRAPHVLLTDQNRAIAPTIGLAAMHFYLEWVLYTEATTQRLLFH